jgi:transcriptional regulator with XRE-family HTH domain
MDPPRPGVHERFRRAREELNQSQRETSSIIGVSQAALSQFERGRHDVISASKLALLATALGIEFDPCELRRPSRPQPTLLWACVNPECIANLPVFQDGTIRLVPAMARAAADALACGYCGKPRINACPHCGALLAGGAYCVNPDCGQPLLADIELGIGGDRARQWAEAERQRRQDILRATAPRDVPLGWLRGPAPRGRREGASSPGPADPLPDPDTRGPSQ